MWPESLVAELASRRCIIFFGAGVSAGSVNAANQRPPDWVNLLKEAARQIPAGSDRDAADRLIASGRYLDASEIIFSTIVPADRNNFYRTRFLTPRFAPSALHEAIRDIDAKIVVTTNYDNIYEQVCPIADGYNVRKYTDPGLLDDIRSPVRLILKAHGCVTDPQNIVLTRSGYYRARDEHHRFYRVLDALFLTNTILFVGCSLTDPDIQLTLENANIAARASHSHYAFVERGTHSALSRAIQETYNIKLVEYENSLGDHANAVLGLQKLAFDVEAYRQSLPV